MKLLKIVFVFLLGFFLVGCSGEVSFEEIIGRYESNSFPNVKKATIELRADSTYKQFIILGNNDTLQNEEHWEYYFNPELKRTSILLVDCILCQKI